MTNSDCFEGHIQLTSVNLFVKQIGRSGPNLVVIHGGPDWDHSYLLNYMIPLSENFKLTFFDIRGCGRSQKFNDANEYSIKNIVKDINELLNKLKIEKTFFWGFSFGGRVLISFLKEYSKFAKGAILASTTAYTDFQKELEKMEIYNERNSNEIKFELNKLFSSNLYKGETSRKMAEITLPLDIANLENLEKAKILLREIKFSDEWMRAWKAGILEKNKENIDAEKILKETNIPILILHGKLDLRFPFDVAKKLHNALPKSDLVICENSGHMAHLEENQKWCSSIVNFINSNLSN